MPLGPIDFDEPLFTREQAIALTRADENTVDNWLRYGHIVPVGEKKARRFSPFNILQAELIYSLANTFKVPPLIGRGVADDAIADYRRFADVDLRDVWNGASIGSVPDGQPGRTTLELVRDADGELRAWQEGDKPEDGVTLVLPTRLLARNAFAKMKAMLEAAKA